MKLFPALALTLSLYAQTPATPKPDAHAELHARAVKLVDAMGVRDQMAASMPAMIDQGKSAMQKQCPDCAAAFVEEWGKRVAARLKVDDFVDVVVRAYENASVLRS